MERTNDVGSAELPQSRLKVTIKDILESLIEELVAKGIRWPEVSAEFEKLFILRALQQTKGILSRTAQTMGIHRNTLSKKIREYGIVKGKHGRFRVGHAADNR